MRARTLTFRGLVPQSIPPLGLILHIWLHSSLGLDYWPNPVDEGNEGTVKFGECEVQ